MLNKDINLIEKENCFSKSIEKRIAYQKKHPEADLISLGIGDVSLPVCKPVLKEMKKAIDDLANMKKFPGYGNQLGIKELRKAILDNEYKKYGFSVNEIYVGEGTKTDSTSILELFDKNSTILVSNPSYPIHENGAHILNRKVYKGKVDKEFKMVVPNKKYDLIYLCTPSNPIGNAYTKKELKKWVDYANKNHSVLLIDNVYKPFVRSKDIPDSIYEIKGAKKCAIEFRSFSKECSFTGVRCSYYVIPKEIEKGINKLWDERTINRFNGASYIAQVGALASFKDEAKKENKKHIDTYLRNADYLRKELIKLGFKVIGGINAPYLWCETPDRLESWKAFDLFLKEMNIIVVPGSIFGTSGKYNIRISSLGSMKDSKRAIKRMKEYYEKDY